MKVFELTASPGSGLMQVARTATTADISGLSD